MNYTVKAKIHEICESVRDEYLLNALEESESVSEKDILKMKKFLNENITRIEKMLVEEGYLELGRKIIEESFKTVAKNIGTSTAAGALGGAAGAAATMYGPQAIQAAGEKLSQLGSALGAKVDQLSNVANTKVDEIINAMQANLGSLAAQDPSLALKIYQMNPELASKIASDPDFAKGFVQQLGKNLIEPVQNVANQVADTVQDAVEPVSNVVNSVSDIANGLFH